VVQSETVTADNSICGEEIPSLETKRKTILAIVITYAAALVLIFGVGWFNGNILPNLTGFVRSVLMTVVWWPLLIPTIVFMRRDKEALKDIGFSKEKIPQQILVGVIVAIGSLLIFIVIPALFGLQMGYVGSLNIFSNVLVFIYVLLANALVEEVLFRGHLFKNSQT